jgi:hypothetical protein
MQTLQWIAAFWGTGSVGVMLGMFLAALLRANGRARFPRLRMRGALSPTRGACDGRRFLRRHPPSSPRHRRNYPPNRG